MATDKEILEERARQAADGKKVYGYESTGEARYGKFREAVRSETRSRQKKNGKLYAVRGTWDRSDW